MMEFASPEETALAMAVTARRLPVLVRSFEEGVREAGQAERVSELARRAFRAGSYDEILRPCMEYVEVR